MPVESRVTVAFSWSHNAVGVTSRDAGAVRPPVAAAS